MIAQTDISSLTVPITIAVGVLVAVGGLIFTVGSLVGQLRQAQKDLDKVLAAFDDIRLQMVRTDERLKAIERKLDVADACDACDA